MIVLGAVKKGVYYDSVSLMIVSKELNTYEGIIDSSVVMGTEENKTLLKAVGLFTREFEDSGETDILVGIRALGPAEAENAIRQVDQLFRDLRKSADDVSEQNFYTYEDAVKHMPGANFALISVAGKYAVAEAMKALKQGLHVMLFSDNVGIRDEIELKQYASGHGLLMMGPDCGTAIINGIPLGFANAVHKGHIGIVGASGTGIQEVSSIISMNGGGISQAVGTGGRDVREETGGIMFLEALRALGEDRNTRTIVLVSKPPHRLVLEKISKEIKKIKKPVIAILLGGDPVLLQKAGAIPAGTLEEAALTAISVAGGGEAGIIGPILEQMRSRIRALAGELAVVCRGKFVRGLYSGGTLCDEAQLVLKGIIGPVLSNSPVDPEHRLADSWKSRGNTIIDLGDDEFTRGRPHPMIDYSLRNRRILREASDPEVAIILLDVVLGFGSHPDPVSELGPVITKAKEISPGILFLGSVTGTDQDPQNRREVVQGLEASGMIILPSNAAAAELAGEVIKKVNSGKS